MINKVILIGRAGKDPDLHTTERKKTVVRFTVATWENYKDEKEPTGWRQVTEWHNVVVWGAAGESIKKHLIKGELVYVEGGVRTRSYTDKEGVTKYITEIVGFARALLAKKDAASSGTAKESPKGEPGKASKPEDTVDIHEEIPPDELSDLPFILTIPIALGFLLQFMI